MADKVYRIVRDPDTVIILPKPLTHFAVWGSTAAATSPAPSAALGSDQDNECQARNSARVHNRSCVYVEWRAQ
jgi:hypothetical protein